MRDLPISKAQLCMCWRFEIICIRYSHAAITSMNPRRPKKVASLGDGGPIKRAITR